MLQRLVRLGSVLIFSDSCRERLAKARELRAVVNVLRWLVRVRFRLCFSVFLFPAPREVGGTYFAVQR